MSTQTVVYATTKHADENAPFVQVAAREALLPPTIGHAVDPATLVDVSVGHLLCAVTVHLPFAPLALEHVTYTVVIQ